MAEPTYTGTPGQGPSVAVIAANIGSDETFFDTYGYRAAVIFRMIKGSDWVQGAACELHHILGTAAPSADATYDAAPICSLYYRKTGGANDSLLYIHAGTGGTDWGPVTQGADA